MGLVDDKGVAPVWAAPDGVDVVEFLLEHGADVGGVLHVVPVAELLLLLGLPGDGNPRAELAAVAVDVGVAGA